MRLSKDHIQTGLEVLLTFSLVAGAHRIVNTRLSPQQIAERLAAESNSGSRPAQQAENHQTFLPIVFHQRETWEFLSPSSGREVCVNRNSPLTALVEYNGDLLDSQLGAKFTGSGVTQQCELKPSDGIISDPKAMDAREFDVTCPPPLPPPGKVTLELRETAGNREAASLIFSFFHPERDLGESCPDS